RQSRPSASLRRCGGFPSPVCVTGSTSCDQETPLSDDFHASIHAFRFPSSAPRRIVVNSSRSESLTVDGIMEYPLGSGPMKETNCQDLPPSVVRPQMGRPSRLLLFDAVSMSMQSCLPLM